MYSLSGHLLMVRHLVVQYGQCAPVNRIFPTLNTLRISGRRGRLPVMILVVAKLIAQARGKMGISRQVSPGPTPDLGSMEMVR